jgi:flagellar protein FlbD
MIKLTKQNDEAFYLNSDIIEVIKEVPHTVIFTIHEQKYLVKETADEVVEKIIIFKRRTNSTIKVVKEGE